MPPAPSIPQFSSLRFSPFLQQYVMYDVAGGIAPLALEDTLKSWAKAPGQTEQTKCDNAVTAVRKAIAASDKLSKLSIKVFAQGSYCNRTNVREDSDVDVCVRCSDNFFYYMPPDLTPANCGFSVPGPVQYPTYKNEVGAALTAYFKDGHVTPGNKAFDIKENTYRIAADVVPCFEFRRYAKDGTHIKGTAFDPDNGGRIQNWPDQHYDNGVSKNTTGGRFKDVVRTTVSPGPDRGPQRRPVMQSTAWVSNEFHLFPPRLSTF
jgi:hypothetical protein